MMTGAELIAIVHAGIDYAITLGKSRKTRKRDYFEKVVDPMYRDFVPLGQDILVLFRCAKASLNGTKKERQKAFKAIQEQRDTFADARAALRASAERFRSAMGKREPPLVDFVSSLASFFMPDAPGYYVPPAASRAAGLLRRYNEFEQSLEAAGRDPEHDKERLEEFICRATAELERSWYEIAGRHTDLKLKYMVD